ncbi:MAG: hypothetical protein JW880_08630 [Candidatus Thermoplasmatota archaeon]|nr:hypothetical protein [Candidatus Thermoplasmatota archaeon]
MDFIISKVAMSVCGLLMVGVLSGCMDPAHLADPGHELDQIIGRFCDLVDRAVLSRSECSLTWTVPCLADGQDIEMTISGGIVSAEGGGHRAYGKPVTGIHAWQHTGAAMNMTGLRLLDSSSEDFVVISGEPLIVSTELVLLENQPNFLAFVQRAF